MYVLRYPVSTPPPLTFSSATITPTAQINMKAKFKVLKCTPKADGKGFVWTLEATYTAKCFNVEKTVVRKYYIGNMSAQVEAGTIVEDDITRYDIKVWPYTFTPEGMTEKVTIDCHWLHLRVGA